MLIFCILQLNLTEIDCIYNELLHKFVSNIIYSDAKKNIYKFVNVFISINQDFIYFPKSFPKKPPIPPLLLVTAIASSISSFPSAFWSKPN